MAPSIPFFLPCCTLTLSYVQALTLKFTPFPSLVVPTDKLGKQLRAIQGSALKVVGVHPISAASRQTAVFSPLPHALAGGGGGTGTGDSRGLLPRCIDPIEVLVQLENSGERLAVCGVRDCGSYN